MGWLENVASEKESLGFGEAGGTTQSCPRRNTGMIVVVIRSDNEQAVASTKVTLVGPSGQTKPTGSNGLASFRFVTPGKYKINLALPTALAEQFQAPPAGFETVVTGSCPVHVVRVGPLAVLKVKVVFDDKTGQGQPKILDGVTVEIKGPDEKQEKTGAAPGWSTFDGIKSGSYRARIVSLGQHATDFAPETSGEPVEVVAGKPTEFVLKVVPTGWVEFVVLDTTASPHAPVPGVKIAARVPGEKLVIEPTNSNGAVRIEKLSAGTVDLVELSTEDDIWEVVSLG